MATPPYIADAEIGPRILARLRWRFPAFTVRRIASELGCSIGLVSKMLNGQTELGIGALLGLARACGDAEILLGQELASLDYGMVKLAKEGEEAYEVELEATQEIPGRYRLAVLLSRALEAVAAGGGASLSDDDLRALFEHERDLAKVLEMVRAANGAALKVVP